MFPGAITGFHDTAALLMNMDVVLSVDTAIAHLAGALGRPTWIMLQRFAVDWRWLLARSDSPWYPTARLFRQENFDDWSTVIREVSQYISWFKV
jgi:ADP-heptose:LPS heptosyltransferase